MSRSTDYPRPSVKEHRANLEAIPKRDCSNKLAGPVKRTLKLGTWPSNGNKVIDARFEGARSPRKSGFPRDIAKILPHHQGFSEWMMDRASAKCFLNDCPKSILICALDTNTSAGRVLIRPQTMCLPSQIVITCRHPENLVWWRLPLDFIVKIVFL